MRGKALLRRSERREVNVESMGEDLLKQNSDMKPTWKKAVVGMFSSYLGVERTTDSGGDAVRKKGKDKMTWCLGSERAWL